VPFLEFTMLILHTTLFCTLSSVNYNQLMKMQYFVYHLFCLMLYSCFRISQAHVIFNMSFTCMFIELSI